MIHRIQMTFGKINGQSTLARSQAILESIKSIYKWVGHANANQTLPLKPGEWYSTKDGVHLYAVFHVEESEMQLTAEDMELLSTVVV